MRASSDRFQTLLDVKNRGSAHEHNIWLKCTQAVLVVEIRNVNFEFISNLMQSFWLIVTQRDFSDTQRHQVAGMSPSN